MVDLTAVISSQQLAVAKAIHNIEISRCEAKIQQLQADVDRYKSLSQYYEQLLIHEKLKNGGTNG